MVMLAQMPNCISPICLIPHITSLNTSIKMIATKYVMDAELATKRASLVLSFLAKYANGAVATTYEKISISHE